MKKLLILLVIVGIGYQYRAHWMPQTRLGAFDEQGKPQVVVFVNDQCQGPCDQATDFLTRRDVTYEVVNVSQNPAAEQTMREWGSPGRLPMIMVGKVRLDGYLRAEVDSALAEAYGIEVLTEHGRAIMQKHFDENGNPRVIMYGVTWCPHCKKARAFFDENNIAYIELDPEQSSEAKEAYQWLDGGGYPLIYVGARRVSGFHQETVKQTLTDMF